MDDDTRSIPPSNEGGKKKPKEPLFLYCATHRPGFPSGHRASRELVFARWRNYLWQMLIETEENHANRSLHDRHLDCAAGSMMVTGENPHTAILQQIIGAQREKNLAREQALFAFVIHPARERKGASVNVIIGGSEIDWRDIEDAALGLARFSGGDLSEVDCVWKDRDDTESRNRWKRAQAMYIAELRQEPAAETSTLSPGEIAQAARENGVTPEEAREHYRELGYDEDEQGNFVLVTPAPDEGDGETAGLLLRSYAKLSHYTGKLYISAHSWSKLVCVAGGRRWTVRFPGERAWYGYFPGMKMLICIPLESRFDPKSYPIFTIGGDPDFLEAMDEVIVGPSDVVQEGLAALEEKEKKAREEHKPPEEKPGGATGEVKT